MSVSKPSRDRDEDYVIDLIDAMFDERASRQHRFSWLVGDAGSNGARVGLPVDAYYPGKRLVVEYRERPHTESVPHFDKVDRMTVSGVHRGEQRRIYDERREHEIPANGLSLVIIHHSDLAGDSRGRLLQRPDRDPLSLQNMLAAHL